MRADAAGTGMVEVRKGYGARLAVSVIASLVLAIAVVPMLAAGTAWGLVAATVVLAIAAGVDAALVLDRMMSGAPRPSAPEATLEPAA
ncbi:MAG: hypothetical protein ACRDO7_16305 [Nocardioidaceae bacterium]